jgi:hypothetical protein
VAQHHGLPTRLIDWTYSAAAALWFAVKDGVAHNNWWRHEEFCGVVWILRTEVSDFAPLEKTDPFTIDKTQLFRPRVIAHRIQAQAGLFTVHSVKERDGRPDFIPLEINSVLTARLTRVPIKASCFRKLRDELDVFGVNESTMYPDLDGVCKHLQWRYTKGPLGESMRASYPNLFSGLNDTRDEHPI